MKNTTINIEEAIQTINKQNKRIEELCLEIERLHSIIKEVREYIQDRYDGEVLTHTFDKDNVGELLEILGSEKE